LQTNTLSGLLALLYWAPITENRDNFEVTNDT
jgi:hypothetical protein